MNRATARTSALDQENPVSLVAPSTQHQLCCSCTLCCGLKCSWRDGIMFAVEGGTAISSLVTFILTQNFYLGGGLLAITAGECLVHGLWRRDAAVADLHRVVVDIGHEDDKLAETAKKTDEVADKLIEENSRLNREKTDFQAAKKQWDQTQSDLSKQIVQLQGVNEQLQNEKKDLARENLNLKTQTEHLQQIVKAIKDHLLQFNKQNVEIKSNVDKLSDVVIDFGKQDDELKKVIDEVDKELDQDIDELVKQVELAQKTSHEIFSLLSDQNLRLQDEIKNLQTTVSEITKEEDEIGERNLQLIELEKKTTIARDSLQAIEKEFQLISQALIQAKDELKDERQKLEETHQKFSTDNETLKQVNTNLSQIANQFDGLEKKLEVAVIDLKKINSETNEKQKIIDEI